MKIVQHFFDEKSGESKIFLDLEGKTVIVYVTERGKQVLPLGFEPEQYEPIYQFINEYFETIEKKHE